MVPLIQYLGSKSLEEAATRPSWKAVRSAASSLSFFGGSIPNTKKPIAFMLTVFPIENNLKFKILVHQTRNVVF